MGLSPILEFTLRYVEEVCSGRQAGRRIRLLPSVVDQTGGCPSVSDLVDRRALGMAWGRNFP